RRAGLGPARGAEAAEPDVVAGDRVSGLPLDVPQRPLEVLVGERLDLAAVVADEVVVVVLAAGVDRLEAVGARADVDALDEPVPAQLLERAGHAGDPDPPPPVPPPVEDLLRGEAALLPAEELDHRAPRASVAVALRAQRAERRLRPVVRRGLPGHGLTIPALDND